MKILLTGAAGQVGREIEELAKIQNISIIAYNRTQLDITDAHAVLAEMSKHQDVTCLINAAAYTAVDLAEDQAEKAAAINSIGVKNLAQTCLELDIPLLHISTDYVFSGEKEGSYVEQDEPMPQGVYGATKLEGERIIESLLTNYIILRVSWVFGQYGKNFVKTISRLAKEKTEMNIVSDQIGNPTPAADIARVLLVLSRAIANNQAKWGTYHYCGAETVSWHEFAQHIVQHVPQEKRQLKETKPIPTSAYPTKAKRPQNSRLNCDKIRHDFGVEQHSWHDYLQNVCETINDTTV